MKGLARTSASTLAAPRAKIDDTPAARREDACSLRVSATRTRQLQVDELCNSNERGCGQGCTIPFSVANCPSRQISVGTVVPLGRRAETEDRAMSPARNSMARRSEQHRSHRPCARRNSEDTPPFCAGTCGDAHHWGQRRENWRGRHERSVLPRSRNPATHVRQPGRSSGIVANPDRCSDTRCGFAKLP
jgi:hypothetical protein